MLILSPMKSKLPKLGQRGSRAPPRELPHRLQRPATALRPEGPASDILQKGGQGPLQRPQPGEEAGVLCPHMRPRICHLQPDQSGLVSGLPLARAWVAALPQSRAQPPFRGATSAEQRHQLPYSEPESQVGARTFTDHRPTAPPQPLAASRTSEPPVRSWEFKGPHTP